MFSTIMQERREGSHTRGVWPTEKGSGAEHLLAVKCRVFMGPEERLCKTADKGGGEIRISRLREQGLKEGKAGNLHGGKHAEPIFLLHPKELQPPAQLGKGDAEAFA